MKQIIVNVSGLTIEEKQRVNQALAKIVSIKPCRVPQWIEVRSMCTSSSLGSHMGWSSLEARDSTHTPQQVLEMAGMAKQGHVHSELMAQYAEDAKTTDKPWMNFQWSARDGKWLTMQKDMQFESKYTFRRKPKTRIVHGVEIPDFEFTPKVGEEFYTANVGLPEFFEHGQRLSECCTFTQRMIERGLIYPYSEEGKQAAILHSKAMLGIA